MNSLASTRTRPAIAVILFCSWLGLSILDSLASSGSANPAKSVEGSTGSALPQSTSNPSPQPVKPRDSLDGEWAGEAVFTGGSAVSECGSSELEAVVEGDTIHLKSRWHHDNNELSDQGKGSGRIDSHGSVSVDIKFSKFGNAVFKGELLESQLLGTLLWDAGFLECTGHWSLDRIKG